MRFTKILSTLLLAGFFGNQALAVEEQPRVFRGIRSAGMGGLITTTGNYGEALFGNPARHSEVDTWKWSLLDITLEVNSNLVTTSKDLSKVKGSSGSGTISNASKIIGKTEHALLQLMTAYYNPKFIGDMGFAIGILAKASTSLTVNYTTDIDTQTIVDVGPHLGFSHQFLEDTLSIGLNLHGVFRVASDGAFSALDFLTGSKLSLQNFGRQGFGIDGDLGAYYHVPWELPFMRIAVGLSGNNLAKSHYDDIPIKPLSGVGTRPVNNDRVLNGGFRLDFPDAWILSAPLFAFEMQDMGDTQKRMSFFKRTHMGGEAKLTRILSFRAGFNQGYYALGLGINLPLLKIDGATYGEELTGNVGQQEDRRYVVRVALEL